MNMMKIIKNLAEKSRSKPVNAVVDGIVKNFSMSKYDINHDNTPYLRFAEWYFGAKKKGLKLSKASVTHWPKLFKKYELIITESYPHIHDYAKIILKETVAHRYADYYRLFKKYEGKFNEYYSFSNSVSSLHNYGLHIDGSLFWNGVAYERSGNILKASKYYKKVVLNRLTYKDPRMPILKVQSSFNFFEKYPKFAPQQIHECVIKLEEQNDKLKLIVGENCAISNKTINYYKKKWKNAKANS